jgi:hypothetical protein
VDNISNAPEDNSPSEATIPPGSNRELAGFLTALNGLRLDSNYVLASLTELLSTFEPLPQDGLSPEDAKYLIESGTFTATELTAAQAEVDRGGLERNAIEAFLAHLLATLSLDEAAGFLGKSEPEVRAAVGAGDLHAVTIAGRLRFPSWQFHLNSPNKLLPGFDRHFLAALVARWPDWRSCASFMSTPQEDLVAEGRQTPTAWLGGGGDPEEVLEIVEAEDFW